MNKKSLLTLSLAVMSAATMMAADEVSFNSTLEPSKGSMLSNVSIVFDDMESNAKITDLFNCRVLKEGSVVASLDKSAADAKYNVVNINVTPVMEDLGNYEIIVEAGSISLTSDGMTETNPTELKYTYTVTDGPSYHMTPASGSTVNELSKVTLLFNRDIKLAIPYYQVMKIRNADNDVMESTATASVLDDNRTLVLTIDPPIKEKGTYNIIEVRYCFEMIVSGFDSPEWLSPIPATFNVDPSVAPDTPELARPYVSPSVYFSIESAYLDTIEFLFQEGCEVLSIDEEIAAETYLAPKLADVDANMNVTYYYGDPAMYYDYAISKDKKSVILTKKANSPGIYDMGMFGMFLPAGLITTNQGTNPEWEFSWNVGSISGVKTINSVESGKVYNIAGVRVLENAGNDDVKALAPGLYIINGKKIIIK